MAKNVAPMTEAEIIQERALVEHAERQKPGAKVALPNGTRISATPYIGMRYQGMDATKMLGDPASILKDPKPGWKYVWKKRTDRQTMAWERSGILIAIHPDEVDDTNPMAEYSADVTGTNTYVTWESLSLFAMPPKWVKKIYLANEEWAISRLVQQPAAIQSEFGNVGAEAKMTVTAKP
jgi:hypothetical protein